MVYATRSRFLAILLLCFCVNVAVAERWAVHLHRRDGPTNPSTTLSDVSTSQSTQPSQTASNNRGSSTTESSAKATADATENSTSSSTSLSATSTQAAITAVTSDINGAAPSSVLNHNSSSYNYTLTPNLLPIEPKVTPGFAVGGVILMISGFIYTLVGIKNKWLHISFSAAYLASLSVTVLIIYVMSPPVSNAIQGAYLVAVVVTGLIFGGASLLIKEMTEGLGCLLGGFCFSMWLLVLKPGGLLTSTSSKAILIAVFTIAGFSTSFSHITRPYGLIGLMSFAGATTLVLGIDCFSRAGLKEFWVYLWDLNDNLFPLGATSYPLTKGIKVEIAAIVVIFLAGVVSQMKIWKIIKDRRSRREAERLNDERSNEQAEENVGRRIENANARERGQWEAVYGDKDITKSNNSDRDSGVGDMDSKKGPTSTVASVKGEDIQETIEMTDMLPPTATTGAGLVMTDKDGGPITVRVARDIENPELDESGNPVSKSPALASPRNSTSQAPEEQVWVVGADGEARPQRRPSKRNSNGVPKIVPLPFTVPSEDIPENRSQRSSVATFADEDPSEKEKRRRSKHLSVGSQLMRKLSQISKSQDSPTSPTSPRSSRHLAFGRGGASVEDLVIPRGEVEDDRASSIAATMDGLSDDEEMRSVRSSVHHAPDTTEVAGPAKGSEIVKDVEKLTMEPELSNGDKPEVTDDAKEIVEEVPQTLIASTDPKPDSELAIPKQKTSASNVSAIESKPSSITKERLPAQLSKIVMSYRTNEWAKHLSQADAPDLEELKLAQYTTEESSNTPPETAVPVKVEELQQTAESSTQQRPTPSRTPSQHQPLPQRSNSSLSRTALERLDSNLAPKDGLNRTSSQQSSSSLKAINTSNKYRSVSSPLIPQPIVESPIEEQFSNFPSNNLPPSASTRFSQNPAFNNSPSTLISKRDSMLQLRQRTLPSQTLSSTPENPSRHSLSRQQSDTGSIHQSTWDEDIDDNISLAARRDQLIRQSSQGPLNLPHPQRTSTLPSPAAREAKLASWRASVQSDLANNNSPVAYGNTVGVRERKSQLWGEKERDERRRMEEERARREKERVMDERMRRGDMLDAHREALRRMQRGASVDG